MTRPVSSAFAFCAYICRSPCPVSLFLSFPSFSLSHMPLDASPHFTSLCLALRSVATLGIKYSSLSYDLNNAGTSSRRDYLAQNRTVFLTLPSRLVVAETGRESVTEFAMTSLRDGTLPRSSSTTPGRVRPVFFAHHHRIDNGRIIQYGCELLSRRESKGYPVRSYVLPANLECIYQVAVSAELLSRAPISLP